MGLSKDDAKTVAKALGVNDRQSGGGLPPAASRGGIPSQTGRGIGQAAAGTATASGKANLVEVSRVMHDTASASTTMYTSDGLFVIGAVPIKTLTLAEANTSGNAVAGTEFTITFKTPG